MGQSEKRHVKAAAIIKIKHIGLVDYRVRIGGTAKAKPTRWYPADRAAFDREAQVTADALFISHERHALWHAYAEVSNGLGNKFHSGAAGNDFAFIEW